MIINGDRGDTANIEVITLVKVEVSQYREKWSVEIKQENETRK